MPAAVLTLKNYLPATEPGVLIKFFMTSYFGI